MKKHLMILLCILQFHPSATLCALAPQPQVPQASLQGAFWQAAEQLSTGSQWGANQVMQAAQFRNQLEQFNWTRSYYTLRTALVVYMSMVRKTMPLGTALNKCVAWLKGPIVEKQLRQESALARVQERLAKLHEEQARLRQQRLERSALSASQFQAKYHQSKSQFRQEYERRWSVLSRSIALLERKASHLQEELADREAEAFALSLLTFCYNPQGTVGYQATTLAFAALVKQYEQHLANGDHKKAQWAYLLLTAAWDAWGAVEGYHGFFAEREQIRALAGQELNANEKASWMAQRLSYAQRYGVDPLVGTGSEESTVSGVQSYLQGLLWPQNGWSAWASEAQQRTLQAMQDQWEQVKTRSGEMVQAIQEWGQWLGTYLGWAGDKALDLGLSAVVPGAALLMSVERASAHSAEEGSKMQQAHERFKAALSALEEFKDQEEQLKYQKSDLELDQERNRLFSRVLLYKSELDQLIAQSKADAGSWEERFKQEREQDYLSAVRLQIEVLQWEYEQLQKDLSAMAQKKVSRSELEQKVADLKAQSKTIPDLLRELEAKFPVPGEAVTSLKNALVAMKDNVHRMALQWAQVAMIATVNKKHQIAYLDSQEKFEAYEQEFFTLYNQVFQGEIGTSQQTILDLQSYITNLVAYRPGAYAAEIAAIKQLVVDFNQAVAKAKREREEVRSSKPVKPAHPKQTATMFLLPSKRGMASDEQARSERWSAPDDFHLALLAALAGTTVTVRYVHLAREEQSLPVAVASNRWESEHEAVIDVDLSAWTQFSLPVQELILLNEAIQLALRRLNSATYGSEEAQLADLEVSSLYMLKQLRPALFGQLVGESERYLGRYFPDNGDFKHYIELLKALGQLDVAFDPAQGLLAGLETAERRELNELAEQIRASVAVLRAA